MTARARLRKIPQLASDLAGSWTAVPAALSIALAVVGSLVTLGATRRGAVLAATLVGLILVAQVDALRPVTVPEVVTAHNEHAFIEDCLRSVDAQSWADFECIVTDDASTDTTLELASDVDGLPYPGPSYGVLVSARPQHLVYDDRVVPAGPARAQAPPPRR